nr:hypothetical protein [bacterium]
NTLEVNKLGLGSGTVASSPAGIDCGVDCSEIYIGEPLITLSAVPNAGSEFAGWSGVVCEGGAQSAQSGGSELMISAPLFGGGGGTAQASSSSSMNTCDVSLDVSNTTSTTAIASFNLCANLPVRVVGAQDYTTVQAGYAAAPEGGTIQVQAGRFIESPDMNIDKTVTIQGGYDCDYLGVIGITLIKGNLTISDGAVTVSDIEIEP